MPVFHESDIPEELWAQEMLFMPICLSGSYTELLQGYGKMDAAVSLEDVAGPIGGEGREATLEHFARRYGVSSCRIESLVLDPRIAFGNISDDLVTSLSSGRIAILDAPCGSGAVGASLLSSIAVLRKNSVLPKLPLDIDITGGDCSETAREIYTKMIAKLEPALNIVGIEINLKTVPWDARNADTTASLVDTWFGNNIGYSEYLAIIANFSGEAGKSFEDFRRSFQHIHDRLYNKKCTVVWVEPEMPGAQTFLQKIQQALWRKKPIESPVAHTYHWYNPLQKRKLPCRVLVYRYKRA